MATWILWPLGAYLLLISGYMLVIVAAAWLYKGPPALGKGSLRIAVVVPAHNEGARLQRTLQDLLACDYPQSSRTVFVIADNCNDDTAAMASSTGAVVFERHDVTARGKGPALDWLLRQHVELLSTFDIIAFVDADMFVDRKFLAALNGAFSNPSTEIVQGRNTVANPAASWLASFGFMSFAYVNHVRPSGRCFIGGSCGLKGSGMAFRSGLILSKGWPSHSVAEDLDFGKSLALEGHRIHYAPAAAVTSDIASTLRQVGVQQARWESGKHQAALAFLPQVLRRLVRRPSMLLLDEVLDMLVPPLSIVATLAVACLAGAFFTAAIPLWIPFSCLLVFGSSVATGLFQLRAPAKTLFYLLLTPGFVVLKIVLFLKLAISPKQRSWNRTPRDGEHP